jgi:hypothetical protein
MNHSSNLPAFDEVLHLYDKGSTRVLVYCALLIGATTLALALDLHFGIPPGTVLLWVSTLMVVIVFGSPAAYIVLRRYLSVNRSVMAAPVRVATSIIQDALRETTEASLNAIDRHVAEQRVELAELERQLEELKQEVEDLLANQQVQVKKNRAQYRTRAYRIGVVAGRGGSFFSRRDPEPKSFKRA